MLVHVSIKSKMSTVTWPSVYQPLCCLFSFCLYSNGYHLLWLAILFCLSQLSCCPQSCSCQFLFHLTDTWGHGPPGRRSAAESSHMSFSVSATVPSTERVCEMRVTKRCAQNCDLYDPPDVALKATTSCSVFTESFFWQFSEINKVGPHSGVLGKFSAGCSDKLQHPQTAAAACAALVTSIPNKRFSIATSPFPNATLYMSNQLECGQTAIHI